MNYFSIEDRLFLENHKHTVKYIQRLHSSFILIYAFVRFSITKNILILKPKSSDVKKIYLFAYNLFLCYILCTGEVATTTTLPTKALKSFQCRLFSSLSLNMSERIILFPFIAKSSLLPSSLVNVIRIKGLYTSMAFIL